MTANPLSRDLYTQTQVGKDVGPRRTLIVRTPQRTYGFRYSGLLKWDGTNERLTLHFTTDDVILYGKELLKHYAAKLADDLIGEFMEPLRTEKFQQQNQQQQATGSIGIERIDVVPVKP